MKNYLLLSVIVMGAFFCFCWLWPGNGCTTIYNYRPGTLGGSYSFATGINNSGQVVGDSRLTGNNVTNAFLYDGTGMHDLGTLGEATLLLPASITVVRL